MAAFSYHSMLLSPLSNSSDSLSQFYDATEKRGTENDSTGVDKLEHGEQATQNVKWKTTLDSAQSMEQETWKRRKQKKCNDEMKNEKKQKEKEALTEYIHVRAQRGQATDSHSLAERLRRRKSVRG